MEDQARAASLHISRETVLEIIAGLVIILVTFAAIARTDVSSVESLLYWNALIVLLAVAALAGRHLHGSLSMTDYRAVIRILSHWVAVLVVLHLVFVLVSTGRMANADVGLTCGFILTLGTLLDGVHGNWRMIALGVALGLLALGMAIIEQYLWVVSGVAVLTIVVLLAGSWLTRHRKPVPERVN
jgi:hypothetical protein